MKATINDIQYFNRKNDGKEVTKITFEPIITKDEVVLLNPRWYDGHLSEKLKGRIAKVE
jgi:hypothetical protein